MNSATSSFGPIRQMAYVVEDVHASVAQWLRGTGVGPWFVFRNVAMAARYRGRDSTVCMDVALGYQGDIEIELIQPTSFSDSPYVGADRRALLGPHHIAYFTDDLAAATQRAVKQGLDQVFYAHNPVTQVAYFELAGAHGVRYELIQYTSEGLAGWQGRLRAAHDWDGAEPLREFDLGKPA